MKQLFLLAVVVLMWSPVNSQTIPPYVPQCGLIAWYPFTGNAIDSTLHGNNGVVHGAALTTDRFGNANSAYYFNGSSDYIYIAPDSTPNHLYLPGSVSISAWVKSPDYVHGGQAQIFWRGDNVGAHDQYMLYTWGSSIGMRRDVGTGGTTTQLGMSVAGIDTNFHHFVCTYDSVSGNMCVYKDGTLSVTSPLPGIESYPTGAFFNIIGAVNYSPSWQYWLGKIDDIGVWNRAITLCEVQELYYAVVGHCSDTLHSTSDTVVCASAAPITLSGHSGYTSFIWSTGSTSPSISVSASGTYWVYSFNGTCGVAADTFHVTFASNDTTYTHTDTTVCQGSGPVTLSAPSGYSSYMWNTGSTSSSIVVSTAGTWWVTASAGACSMLVDTFHLTYSVADTLKRSTDTTVCASATPVTLQAPPGYSNYVWSTGSTTSSITVSLAGDWWVNAHGSGCNMISYTFHVIVNPMPVVSLGNDTSVCLGKMLTLNASPLPGATYLWSTGSTGPSLSIARGGQYSITATVNGCSTTVDINIGEELPPTLHLGADTILCNSEQMILSAIYTGGSLLWNTRTNAESITVVQAGKYWATVTNSCGTASDTVNVTYQVCDIGFPSAFTPNDDGKNDIIRAVGNLEKYSGYNLSIFNRFGERVFFTDNIFSGWNGIYKGTKQDVGTYYYMLRFDFQGKTHLLKGDFELIR